MDVRQFHRRLYDAAGPLIPPGSTAICAVSGGADSVAMLFGLAAVNEIHRCDWRLQVAHLDHALRPDSDVDAALVRRLAAQLDAPCEIGRVEVAREARERGESIETAARRARYAFLERVARQAGAVVVAAAHHADDQAETVLHRIVRGTGLCGLGGMAARRRLSPRSEVQLVRPMLAFRRCELRAYVGLRELRHRDDPTNSDTSQATRNWIRQEVLPLLERRLNPQAVEALARLAHHARQVDEALRLAAEEALARLLIDGDGTSLRLSFAGFAAIPAAIRGEVIREALRRLDVPLREVGTERIGTIAHAVLRGGRPRRVELPGGVLVEQTTRELRISFHGSRRCGPPLVVQREDRSP